MFKFNDLHFLIWRCRVLSILFNDVIINTIYRKYKFYKNWKIHILSNRTTYRIIEIHLK